MTDEKNSIDSPVGNETTGASIKPSPTPDASVRHSVPSPPQALRVGHGGVWLILLLMIAGAIYATWYFAQQYRSQQDQLINLQEQLQQQQRALALQQQTLEADIDQQIAQQRDAVQDSLNDMGQRIENMAKRVLAMSSVSRDDWKLAEAEYLLRLANQRVLLERNSANALALAQTVDDILRNLNDPSLHPVRRALAAEMSELKLAGDIDREGVYLRLLALSQQLDKLPLIEPLGPNDDPWLLAEEEYSAADTWWTKTKRAFNNLLREFSHHLRVRDHAKPVPAILPPDNRIYLQQNLRLMLEQAQAALLREEAEVYQASLEKAREWLESYFPLNPQSVAAQAEIAELQTAVISQSLPNFAESTQLLKAYVERRHAASVSRRGGNE